ncbi:hypothetical protein HW555_004201 [Spodoptera exigua]|uniref:Kazal-like domain-containing protein n=1 Tax=Spodoptera exigua TaxID=7107 RepID=A0A835GK77_SPOEX|nr:hypothetical protein HW555_004201 [Spodoptera exigua]
MMLLIISTLGENCDDILCANVFDEVCGMAELNDGTQIIKAYKNICFMKKKECELGSLMDVTIQQLYSCYTNPRVLLFMQKIAIMNSLNLLGSDLPPPPDTPRYSGQSGRRINSEQAEDMDDETLLKKHLEEVMILSLGYEPAQAP